MKLLKLLNSGDAGKSAVAAIGSIARRANGSPRDEARRIAANIAKLPELLPHLHTSKRAGHYS